MSNAERQKKYRERKKAEQGENYLRKEVQRVKKYYVPTSELSKKSLSKRRKRIKESMRKHRQRAKEGAYVQQTQMGSSNDHIQTEMQTNDDEPGPCDSTTGSQPRTSSNGQHLVVKMDFKNNSHRVKRKRRINKSLSRANKKVKTLELKVKALGLRNATLRKRVQRLKDKVDKSQTKQNDSKTAAVSSTPKSRTRVEVNSLNMTPNSRKKVRKQLFFKNCLVGDTEASALKAKGRAKQRTVLGIVCGKLIHKYRMGRQISTCLGVHRKQILKARIGKSIKRQRLISERQTLTREVESFMERDDNSTCLPGKKDAHKDGKEHKQKRILNDYIYNLHRKFLAENSNTKISLTVFRRMRPKHISVVKFSNRKTCLCQRHQNMVLKLKALKTIGMPTTENPDTYVEQKSDDEILSDIENLAEENIKFAEWKRVEVERKGRTFKRMQIVTSERPREEFATLMRTELREFRKHVHRVKVQYGQSRRLKEILPSNHAICHMDFAENYTCGFAEEIQSAYFDKNAVTLHPVVIYYTKEETGNDVKHKSLVVVSDELSHTSSTVFAIMKQVIAEVRAILPNVEMVHYMTDSPTSQYRNKQIFSIVAQHDTIFPGIKATWLYFEAGHGKGPCDGVGGTAKRLADMAVKRHSVIIQSADDFYQWGKTQENSSLKYMFVPKSHCADAHAELTNLVGKQVKGTIQVHAVISLGGGEIAVRDTSCFCEACFENGNVVPACEGWVVHSMSSGPGQGTERGTSTNSLTDEPAMDHIANDIENAGERYQVDAYVAAIYESKWYIGKILEYDSEDQEYHVTFMTGGKKSFRWPENADKIWIPDSDILCSLNEPVKQGKTRNMFKFSEKDLEKAQNLFEEL